KRVAQRIILVRFWKSVNILHKGGLLMKNLWKKVSLIAFIVIVLLIILYFYDMSLFWNQPIAIKLIFLITPITKILYIVDY
ncbi:hypothetical protein B5P41_29215, partial [Bacillus sp. SRB_28]